MTLARRFDDPRVWHLNRRSVAGAVAIGLFIAWLPIPTQMIVAACCAALLRVHVPLSVVMVWFTNPLTVAPLGYIAWFIGARLLGSEPPAGTLDRMGLWDLPQLVGEAWPEVLAGCLFAGACSAVMGYLLTLTLWRVSTIRRWRRRSRPALERAVTSPRVNSRAIS